MKRLFEGYEAEGILRGIWTLFVSGDVPFEEIEKRLDRKEGKRPYIQIYFGADNRSEINWETVRLCINYGRLFVTVEVTEPVPFMPEIVDLSNFTIMIPIQNQPKLQEIIDSVRGIVGKIQLKFETDLFVYVIHGRDVVDNSKLEYGNDKELWRETPSKS